MLIHVYMYLSLIKSFPFYQGCGPTPEGPIPGPHPLNHPVIHQIRDLMQAYDLPALAGNSSFVGNNCCPRFPSQMGFNGILALADIG
jgi:hypothetical protein